MYFHKPVDNFLIFQNSRFSGPDGLSCSCRSTCVLFYICRSTPWCLTSFAQCNVCEGHLGVAVRAAYLHSYSHSFVWSYNMHCTVDVHFALLCLQLSGTVLLRTCFAQPVVHNCTHVYRNWTAVSHNRCIVGFSAHCQTVFQSDCTNLQSPWQRMSAPVDLRICSKV